MRAMKLALCAAALFAFAAGADDMKSKGTAKGKKAMKGTSVVGCLQKSGDTFMVTNVPGGKGKAEMKSDWTLTGVTADMKLSDHVGHKVKITGNKEADNQFKITAMKHIAATCP